MVVRGSAGQHGNGVPLFPHRPCRSPSFVNGVWTGSVTVWQAANNVWLQVSDSSGHTGTSNAFNVRAESARRWIP